MFCDGAYVDFRSEIKERNFVCEFQIKLIDCIRFFIFNQIPLINCNNKLTEHKNCLVFRFHSDRVAEALSRFGIVERKTGHERVDWLGDIRQDLQRHVLRGLIDGDGWVGTTIKANKLLPNIGLTSSYECCLFVAKWFSDKLDIGLVSPASHIGCFVITYDGKSSCSKIAEYLYKDSTICLDRKYNKAIEIISRWS